MKAVDKICTIAAGVAGLAMIIAAIAVQAWWHIGLGCGLLLISAAWRRESKRVEQE